MNMQNQPSVVAISGRLDALTAPDRERELKQLLEGGATRLVLDLTALEYISSAGLRVLLTVLKAVQANHGQMVLAGASANVASVFKMSGLDTVLPRKTTVEEALASLNPA